MIPDRLMGRVSATPRYDADLCPLQAGHKEALRTIDCAVSFEKCITCGPKLTEKPYITYAYGQNTDCRTNEDASQIKRDYGDSGRTNGRFR